MAERILLNHFAFISEIPIFVILMLVGCLLPSISLAALTLYAISSTQNYVQRIAALMPTTFIILTLVFAALFYSINVRSKLKRFKKLEEKYDDISELVDRLSRDLKIKKPVLLLSEDWGINATVFGGFIQKYLVVSRGLHERARHFPELVEAILGHELSHIKNGDVAMHGIAECMWKSLLLMAPASWVTWSTLTWMYLNKINAAAGWLIYSVLWYVIPAMVVFWLNGAISKLREIRADLRTITMFKKEAPLRETLRLISLGTSGGTGVSERLRAIEGIHAFRDFLKITFISSAIVALLAYGLTFPSPFEFREFHWNPAASCLFLLVPSAFLPKHVVGRLRRSQKSYHFFLRILGDCFTLAAATTIAKSLVDYFPILALLFLDRSVALGLIEMSGGPLAILNAIIYFTVQNFVLLFVCAALVFMVYLMMSLREEVRGKVLMPLVSMTTVVLASIFYGPGLSLIFSALLFLMILCLLVMGTAYGKCPYCGRNRGIYPFGTIRCPCSKILNGGFFITLGE